MRNLVLTLATLGFRITLWSADQANGEFRVDIERDGNTSVNLHSQLDDAIDTMANAWDCPRHVMENMVYATI